MKTSDTKNDNVKSNARHLARLRADYRAGIWARCGGCGLPIPVDVEDYCRCVGGADEEPWDYGFDAWVAARVN